MFSGAVYLGSMLCPSKCCSFFRASSKCLVGYENSDSSLLANIWAVYCGVMIWGVNSVWNKLRAWQIFSATIRYSVFIAIIRVYLISYLRNSNFDQNIKSLEIITCIPIDLRSVGVHFLLLQQPILKNLSVSESLDQFFGVENDYDEVSFVDLEIAGETGSCRGCNSRLNAQIFLLMQKLMSVGPR